MGASRPVFLRFLTCLGDLLPGGPASGAAALGQTAQGDPGGTTSLLLSKARGRGTWHSQLGTASVLWMAGPHGSALQLEQAALPPLKGADKTAGVSAQSCQRLGELESESPLPSRGLACARAAEDTSPDFCPHPYGETTVLCLQNQGGQSG